MRQVILSIRKQSERAIIALPGLAIYRSGQPGGVNIRQIRRELKRRSVIEAVIGHIILTGEWTAAGLKGRLGDALHAVLCAAGHKLRYLGALLRRLFRWLLQDTKPRQTKWRITEPDKLDEHLLSMTIRQMESLQ